MTSCGLNNGPLRGRGEYESRIACHLMSAGGAGRYGVYFGSLAFRKHPYFTQSGKDREDNPTQLIANMRNGSVAGYKYFMIEDAKEIAVSVRGSASGFMLVSNGLHAEPFARIRIEPSRGFAYYRAELSGLDAGKQALYFTYEGSGALDFRSFRLS